MIFLQDFVDLVETGRKLKLPINFIEVIEKHEATFMILKDKQVYVYKLNSKNA